MMFILRLTTMIMIKIKSGKNSDSLQQFIFCCLRHSFFSFLCCAVLVCVSHLLKAYTSIMFRVVSNVSPTLCHFLVVVWHYAHVFAHSLLLFVFACFNAFNSYTKLTHTRRHAHAYSYKRSLNSAK